MRYGIDGRLDCLVDWYPYAPLKLGLGIRFHELKQIETDRLALAIDAALPSGIERADRCGTFVESGAVAHLRCVHDEPLTDLGTRR